MRMVSLCYSRVVGYWPLAMYTMVTWMYACTRWWTGFAILVAGLLGVGGQHQNSSEIFHENFRPRRPVDEQASALPQTFLQTAAFSLLPFLHRFYEHMRVPSVSQHLVVTLIWWCILVPLFTAMQISSHPNDRVAQRRAVLQFLRWNCSPLLLHVHLFNVVFGCFDHFVLFPRIVSLFDLWAGCVGALLYLLFYLGVLDRNGIHVYVILNPRTNWAVLSLCGPDKHVKCGKGNGTRGQGVWGWRAVSCQRFGVRWQRVGGDGEGDIASSVPTDRSAHGYTNRIKLRIGLGPACWGVAVGAGGRAA